MKVRLENRLADEAARLVGGQVVSVGILDVPDSAVIDWYGDGRLELAGVCQWNGQVFPDDGSVYEHYPFGRAFPVEVSLA